jgi:SAM-dependent methyltransferase
MAQETPDGVEDRLLQAWRGEVEAGAVWELIAERERDPRRDEVLRKMAAAESGHRSRLEPACASSASPSPPSIRASARANGVDPAPTMIEVGRAVVRGRSNVRLEIASADQLPVPDERFDLVISTVSFHHWAIQAAGLREVSRVLRPRGRLVLADHFGTDLGPLPLIQAVIARHSA